MSTKHYKDIYISQVKQKTTKNNEVTRVERGDVAASYKNKKVLHRNKRTHPSLKTTILQKKSQQKKSTPYI